MNTGVNYAAVLCNLVPINRILSVNDVMKSEDYARENSSEIRRSIRAVGRGPYRWWLSWTNSEWESVSWTLVWCLSLCEKKVQGETLNGWESRRQLHAVALPWAYCRGWQCDILYTLLNRWFLNIVRHFTVRHFTTFFYLFAWCYFFERRVLVCSLPVCFADIQSHWPYASFSPALHQRALGRALNAPYSCSTRI